jgi:hypothetical protein
MIRPKLKLTLLIALLCSFLVACDGNDDDPNGVIIQECADAVPEALRICIRDMNDTARACYADGASACASDDPDFTRALSSMAEAVEQACDDGQLFSLSKDDLVGRLNYACQSNADAIAWRTFGGPQGAVWSDPPAGACSGGSTTDAEQRACLLAAHETVSDYVDDTLRTMNRCLSGDSCDESSVEAQVQANATAAANAIANECTALSQLIAVNPEIYVERASDQVDCIVPTARPEVAPFEPQCGPSNVDHQVPRGEWTQLVLDGEKWGSMCGDGSEFAMWIRLAPEGEPLDRVIVGLQGGGVCLFEDDCRAKLDGHLFNAMDDEPFGAGGLVDTTNENNPFKDWTILYLPYCNQDVFAGGGVTEHFSDFTVARYGALNLRAGVRVVRDIIWKMMDEAGGKGYRPDELVALLGGWSAGGYGVMYNYNWILDDLLWQRTAAFPDAGGGLDNRELLGVRTLGFTKIPIWGALPNLPPYCFSGNCAVGPDNYMAFAPRLKQVPEQQYLILSNQKDRTQQGDAFFSDEAVWIDAIRKAYCDTKDLNGIQWYLGSDSENSVHTISMSDEFYYGEVAGERLVDWFWRAVADPDSVIDRAEEGNFTTDIPGSHPFPCALP